MSVARLRLIVDAETPCPRNLLETEMLNMQHLGFVTEISDIDLYVVADSIRGALP